MLLHNAVLFCHCTHIDTDIPLPSTSNEYDSAPNERQRECNISFIQKLLIIIIIIINIIII